MLETDDDLITKSAGTPAFMAPECCQAGAFHGKLADLWACGCTLFFFVHGRVPFVNTNVFELYEDIQHKEIEYDQTLPVDLSDLLHNMLERDPGARFPVSNLRLAAHNKFPMCQLFGCLYAALMIWERGECSHGRTHLITDPSFCTQSLPLHGMQFRGMRPADACTAAVHD